MGIYRKIYFILSSSQRKFLVILFFLMLIGMVFETFGIALIFPILAVITKESFIDNYPIVGTIINYFGISPNRRDIILGGGIFMSGIYTIKSAYLLFLTWRQNIFNASLTVDISKAFFAGYMHQPYAFHIQRNSAELIQNVKEEVFGFVGTIASLMLLVSELLVIFGLAVLLTMIEPYAFLLMSTTLTIFSFLYYLSTRKRLLELGDVRLKHNVKAHQQLQQGLGGVKDIKLLGRENIFIEQYEYNMKQRARAGVFLGMVQAIPRSMLELLMVVGMGIVVLVTMVTEGRDVASIIPSLGVFAMAAFRIMPSLNKIIGGFQSLRFNLPMLDKLYSEKSLFQSTASDKNHKLASFKDEIKISNLEYAYPGVKYNALFGLNLSIPVGKSVGFVGPSGAGKTTLIDLILGLLEPTRGNVFIDGKDIAFNTREWQNLIGYIPQDIYLIDDTLRNNIALGMSEDEINDNWIDDAVDESELRDFVENLPDKLNTKVGELGVKLSGGQRQRIGIARALYHKPSVLVLDEATSSLDNKTERSVMKSINALRGEKTIIIITHRLSTIRYCDYIYQLDKGKVTQQGDYESVILRDE